MNKKHIIFGIAILILIVFILIYSFSMGYYIPHLDYALETGGRYLLIPLTFIVFFILISISGKYYIFIGRKKIEANKIIKFITFWNIIFLILLLISIIPIIISCDLFPNSKSLFCGLTLNGILAIYTGLFFIVFVLMIYLATTIFFIIFILMTIGRFLKKH
ncbi:hypothetical protein HYW74_01655 [Candidatus Pacearchaeota archaeon]|nr:hypothetical protein [Candidatus Pacearchaeota archaeon]